MPRSHHSVEFEALRLKTGLSKAETANLLGVTERTVIRYENGDSRPSPMALKWLQEYLDRLPERRRRPAAFKFIDLFAGIGGLRIGFDAIGGQCVFTSEWDKYSQITYRENFGNDHPIAGDIRNYSKDPAQIPAHDVLLAGLGPSSSQVSLPQIVRCLSIPSSVGSAKPNGAWLSSMR
ncbi:transcriptional regulator with XRE-family HTH domain [Bradyrhizobium sp. F1.2.2]|uniref:DNA cytosine methyltransferase n=1 Tax=unclassified Bradyrhizobium TaxID=2631580 RepID=UPI003395804A